MAVLSRSETIQTSKWDPSRGARRVGTSAPGGRTWGRAPETWAREWTSRAWGTCYQWSTCCHCAHCQPHPQLQTVTTTEDPAAHGGWVSQLLWSTLQVFTLSHSACFLPCDLWCFCDVLHWLTDWTLSSFITVYFILHNSVFLLFHYLYMIIRPPDILVGRLRLYWDSSVFAL